MTNLEKVFLFTLGIFQKWCSIKQQGPSGDKLSAYARVAFKWPYLVPLLSAETSYLLGFMNIPLKLHQLNLDKNRNLQTTLPSRAADNRKGGNKRDPRE